MKYRVKTTRGGIIHKLAFCHVCNLQWDLFNKQAKGRHKVHKHCLETGHRIAIETAISSECTLEAVYTKDN